METSGDGVLRVSITVPGAGMVAAVFERGPAERFYGFGVRSDEVERETAVVECWVGEGPYQLDEYPLVEAITPRWAIRRRRDASYFPIPWAISSRGYGVLVDNAELSRFRLGDAATWTVEVLSDHLELRCFEGPAPADVLRRFTETTGRQPHPRAAWFFGPWCQTGHADLVPFEREAEIVRTLHDADAPVSAIETHMRRLPAGAHESRREDERRRARLFHDHGLASLTYLNPFLSQDYERRYATNAHLLQRHPDGSPYVFPAYIGGRENPQTIEGQLDFTQPGAQDLFAELAREAIEDGHDGWMEDFGEYTPIDANHEHNLYPIDYHAAGARAADLAIRGGERPIARFGRSGWTGAARHLPLVWGGDPTTGWGFDGLRSAVTQALSAGLSGIGFFGSDIGGFFSLGDERLDVELLIRWIQFGALSALMRTKAEGVAIPPYERPQIWDAEVLPHWRRWAKLHTQLSPYLMAAAADYGETGMPLMRHMCLVDPSGPAARRSDQYMLGPSLLVAPVLSPGAIERTVTLPAGQWVDLWRSATYDPTSGGLELGAPSVLQGGREVMVPAPLEEIPVFVRAGSTIPLLPPEVWSLAAPHDRSRVRLLTIP